MSRLIKRHTRTELCLIFVVVYTQLQIIMLSRLVAIFPRYARHGKPLWDSPGLYLPRISISQEVYLQFTMMQLVVNVLDYCRLQQRKILGTFYLYTLQSSEPKKNGTKICKQVSVIKPLLRQYTVLVTTIILDSLLPL